MFYSCTELEWFHEILVRNTSFRWDSPPLGYMLDFLYDQSNQKYRGLYKISPGLFEDNPVWNYPSPSDPICFDTSRSVYDELADYLEISLPDNKAPRISRGAKKKFSIGYNKPVKFIETGGHYTEEWWFKGNMHNPLGDSSLIFRVTNPANQKELENITIRTNEHGVIHHKDKPSIISRANNQHYLELYTNDKGEIDGIDDKPAIYVEKYNFYDSDTDLEKSKFPPEWAIKNNVSYLFDKKGVTYIREKTQQWCDKGYVCRDNECPAIIHSSNILRWNSGTNSEQYKFKSYTDKREYIWIHPDWGLHRTSGPAYIILENITEDTKDDRITYMRAKKKDVVWAYKGRFIPYLNILNWIKHNRITPSLYSESKGPDFDKPFWRTPEDEICFMCDIENGTIKTVSDLENLV